ncbi:plasmid mobilization relaxosome protein MobC [Pseudomonas sp. RTC3]|uniref:plasmid mobilization relaxosome protein MobC n=1 Tax=Pseudomonas sp. 5C2 TaxID=3048588 RepID=UPI002AB5A6D2|nr:plasmid mobilization relaxosome protein MobC [Pseudomonas sp. 5C2]MDY7567487.1 plasmid mobilization relaxosome protein MobC [Pseudomonas sp. 5C2]MEB0064549.1 plasmid mobilization relaxosome protein MobC [Pseudomonas sp. RTC3]MEB0243043.1 plasmid mobilization relaxosome protein MobC [Pseudomonas sp. 5C2]
MTNNRTKDKEKRTKRLNVFFNGNEYLQLLGEAKRARMRPSSLVRQKFFATAPPPSVPDLNLDAWVRLAPAAANLNQIARYLNTGMELDIAELSTILAEFRIALVCASRRR